MFQQRIDGNILISTISIIVIFLFVVSGNVFGQQSLRPGGLNVCSRRYTYNTYYTENRRRIDYVDYRTCCKKLWFICTSRCTRSRSRIVYYKVSKLKVKSSVSYFCCSGWARSGNECPNAMCHPSCQNGDCKSPNFCKCKPGFAGKYCEKEINECQATPPPCEQLCSNLRGSYACACRRGFRKIGKSAQAKKCENVNECAASNRLCTCAVNKKNCKASCIDTIGSYRCQCNQGYRLIHNKVCTDVNECNSGNHGCDQICLNMIGGFKCACRPGYWLRSDKKSCYDLNECRRANGGCEQLCTNTKGSYRCSCRAGFYLMYDKTRCKDVNECTRLRPCDRKYGKCLNTYGSFKCQCKTGYELIDSKTCRDVNECNRVNECQQNCHNTQGSYFCSCRKGFTLAANRKSCVDVDECKRGLHECDQICINSVGSYRCRCRPGYYLESNKLTCRALPCKKLYPPHNGFVRCEGQYLGQKCAYSCRPGYKIVGMKERTCQLSSRWSGGVARCYPESCPPARPPVNGSLTLPCVEEYKSSCFVKCKEGFLLKGSKTIKCGLINGKTTWQNNNAVCQEIKLCQPNPCKNGGRCEIKTTTTFECDCSGTSYTGKNCQFGIINISPYPPLVFGKESGLLTITAKPAKELVITPKAINADVKFSPRELVIRYPRSTVRFRVTPRTSGLVRIVYKLSGRNRLQFSPIKDSTIFITSLDDPGKISKIPTENFMENACHRLRIDRCSDGRLVELLSSCPWMNTGTTGYQSISAGESRIPISIAGISLPDEGIKSWMYRTNGILTMSKEVKTMLKEGPKSCARMACKGSTLTKQEHRFLIERNIFARSFLSANTMLAPDWIAIKIKDDFGGFHVNNIQSMVLKAPRMKDLQLCYNLPSSLQHGIFAAQVAFLPITIQMLGKKEHVASSYPVCVAKNICENVTYFSLPKDRMLNFTSDLQALGCTNIRLNIHGLGFSNEPFRGNFFSSFHESNGTKKASNILAKMWFKISAGLTLDNVNVTVKGETFVAPSNMLMAATARFSAKTKFFFQGHILASFAIKAGGNFIRFQVQDDSAEGYGAIGGPNPEIFNNSTDGFHFKTTLGANIKHESSFVTFHPILENGRTDFQFSVMSNIYGGEVNGVQNRAKIHLMARAFTKSIPASTTGLLLAIRMRRSMYGTEYSFLESFKNDVSSLLDKLKSIVEKPYPEFNSLQNHLFQLHDLTVKANDVLFLLKNRIPVLEKSPSSSRRMLMRVRFLKSILRRANSLIAFVKHRPTIQKDFGIAIKYKGRICFNALCFDDMQITIGDSKSNKNWLSVSAVFTANHNIAGLFDVKENSQIYGRISRDMEYFSVNFPVTTKVFGKEVKAHLRLTPREIGFPLRSFEFSDNMHFDLNVFARISKLSTWQSLTFSISGISKHGSKSTGFLEHLITDYIKETSQITERRVELANGKLLELTRTLAARKTTIINKRKAYEQENREYIKQKGEYNDSLAIHERTRKEFQSYRVDRYFRLLEKELNATCTINPCSDVCLPVAVYDACQDKVMVDANTLTCQTLNRKVFTTVEVPLPSDCQLTDYRFRTIYTGNCKRGKDSLLSGALMATGAGVGALVGGPIGAGVGAFIGFIGSLFSSCDETYAVYKEVINRQIGCTLRTYKPKTTFWKEATCFPEKKNVFSGFDLPKECKVNNITCVVVQSPVCVQDNARCVEQRKAVATSNFQKAAVYQKTFEKLRNAQVTLQMQFLKLEEVEKRFMSAKRDYEKHLALLGQTNLEIKLMNISLLNSRKRFSLEYCLSALKHKPQTASAKINKIWFDSNTAAVDDILFRLDVQPQGASKSLEKSFLYDLHDAEASIGRGARRVAREVFCNDKHRARRSVAKTVDSENAQDYFLQNSTAIPLESSEAQKSCIVSNVIFPFFKRAFDELWSIIMVLKKEKYEIDETVKSINAHIKVSNDATVQMQNKLLSGLKKELAQSSGQLLISNVLRQWLDNMEIITGANNFTKCLNFEDCFHAATRQLKLMPAMLNIKKNEYLSMIDSFSIQLSQIHSANSISDLLKATNIQRMNIDRITRLSSFCAGVPKVELVPAIRVTSTVGSTLQLKCIANSEFPVRYLWMHNNKHLLSETSNILTIKVDYDKEGTYACTTSNLAGKNSSQSTYVEVRKSPTFLEEPQDFQYYASMPKEKVPYFYCNASSDPPAQILWYFQPFSSPKTTQFAFSKPVLRIVQPSILNAGFYFCEAENEFGKITSRRARLDVLLSRLPSQAAGLSYNIQVGRSGAPEKNSYERYLASKGKLSANQDINVAFEYQNGREVNVNVKVTDALQKNAAVTGKSELSDIGMLRAVSRSRHQLSNVLERIVSGITENKGRSAAKSLEDSMRINFNGDLCERGYFLHSNGFTCVQCPAGTYEKNGKCNNCSIGTYQNQPGMVSCVNCGDNKVTNTVGSVRLHQCTAPEMIGADVIFALDSSGSIGTRNWRKVKSFVSQFIVGSKIEENDMRIGVITFGTIARVRIPLRNYRTWELNNRLNALAYYGGVTRTNEGLKFAQSEFRRAYKSGRKRVLFVMTDGKSTKFGVTQGFVLTRRAALKILKNNIHVVAVGVGNSVDPAELRAIASYPKKDNVIQYGSFTGLLGASQRISATALKGSCLSSLKDIAIIVEASSDVRSNRWQKVKGYLTELLLKLSVSSDNKFSVSSFSSTLHLLNMFKEIKSSNDIEKLINSMTKDNEKVNYKRALSHVYNDLMTEKRSSLAPTKIIILLTRSVFNRKLLRQIRRDYPDEEVNLLNIVMNFNQEDNFETFSDSLSIRNQFTMAHLTKLVNAIQSINSSTGCQSNVNNHMQ